MMSRRNSMIAGGCNMLGLVLLALSATAGGSAVRAENPSALQNIVFEPITKIVLGIEQRLADLETTVAAFAGSFTSERIVAQQLCVADGSGAQTCITKAQLDALLKGAVQVSLAPVVVEQPTVPAAVEQPAVPAGESVASLPTVAAALPAVTEQPAEAAGEAATPMPEVAAVTPDAAPPATEQTAVVAGDPGAPLATVATAMPPAIEPVEAVVAETAKPETVIAVEQRAKEEEPAHTGTVVANSPASEPTVVPLEEPPVLERLE
jgi:hypothetical protein